MLKSFFRTKQKIKVTKSTGIIYTRPQFSLCDHEQNFMFQRLLQIDYLQINSQKSERHSLNDNIVENVFRKEKKK